MRRRNLLTSGGNPYDNQYLTLVAKGSGEFNFSGSTSSNQPLYSINNGVSWYGTNSSTTISVSNGTKVMFKGTCVPIDYYGIGRFSANTNFDVEGNIMSLLYSNNFKGQTSLSGKNYVFIRLFSGCTTLQSAENLSLPATTLTTNCYNYMFASCKNLTTAPELPATTLNAFCYQLMFMSCSALTTAPELPATTLADRCYERMFEGTNLLPDCTNIDFTSLTVLASGGLKGLFGGTKITDSQLDTILKQHGITNYSLPATTLANGCYQNMFYSCGSLTTAPNLPATILADYCYAAMFRDCFNLITGPQLPATTLESQCYSQMFEYCWSLKNITTALPATTLKYGCYYKMFYGCSQLTTAPEMSPTTVASNSCYQMFYSCSNLTGGTIELKATKLYSSCYEMMFGYCAKLTNITCLATDISATNCTNQWLYQVGSPGIFTKAASMSSWTTGSSGIPNGWTVQNA